MRLLTLNGRAVYRVPWPALCPAVPIIRAALRTISRVWSISKREARDVPASRTLLREPCQSG